MSYFGWFSLQTVLLVTLVGGTAVANPNAAHIDRVLETLAAKGSARASLERGRALGCEQNLDPGFLACARAVQMWDRNAMRFVGLALAAARKTPDSETEGVTLLAMAEILGDPIAASHMKLLPALLATTGRQIREGRAAGLARLREGNAWGRSVLKGVPVALNAVQTRVALRRSASIQRGLALVTSVDDSRFSSLLRATTEEAGLRPVESGPAPNVVQNPRPGVSRSPRLLVSPSRMNPNGAHRSRIEGFLSMINRHRGQPLGLSDLGIDFDRGPAAVVSGGPRD